MLGRPAVLSFDERAISLAPKEVSLRTLGGETVPGVETDLLPPPEPNPAYSN
jgi:hypothetical protein